MPKHNFEKTQKPNRFYTDEDMTKMDRAKRKNKIKRGRKEVEYE